MATTMAFAKVQKYLNAIADLNSQQGNGDVGASPHGRFWNTSYTLFVNGNIPGGTQVECNGNPTPIINKADPAKTPFYLILTQAGGYCGISGGQMPENGPWITDDKYTVAVDGAQVTGAKIMADLLEWLTNGYPQ